jgi:hypothetical protein
MLNNKNINKLITEALAIEAQAAREAGALGFMARALVQATMPHRKTEGNEFERRNGAYTLTMMSPSRIGLPYGSIPRLLLAWITTEAVKTKERELVLGNSLSEFMRELGLVPTGGRWGTITSLKAQTRRLFSTSIHCNYINTGPDGSTHETGLNLNITEGHSLWWEPKSPGQASLFESAVSLTQSFFDEIVNSPVPIDIRALKAIKGSPMALDIYCWLTYRLSYLGKRTEIPWPALQAQFGSSYPMTGQGRRDFKKNFLKHLDKVYAIYPEANVSEGENGLTLLPSKPHVPRLRRIT